jgi:hypothetical protein
MQGRITASDGRYIKAVRSRIDSDNRFGMAAQDAAMPVSIAVKSSGDLNDDQSSLSGAATQAKNRERWTNPCRSPYNPEQRA